MLKNLTQQLKVYIASISQKSKEYVLIESQRDPTLAEIIGLIILVTLLGTTIP